MKFHCYYILLFVIPGDQLERLLLLESEFGVLPGFTPAVDAVIDYVTTVRFIVCAKGNNNVASTQIYYDDVTIGVSIAAG